RTRRHVEIAVVAWILSVAISGLVAIAQVKWGPAVLASFTTTPADAAAGFPGRQIGLSGHPNDLGAAAAIAIAPALLFATSRTLGRRLTFLFVILASLVVSCIALSV